MPVISVPSTLKPLQPYLQRAAETKAQDPVISYWCTYYALQVGLSLKPKEADSTRTQFLNDLMDDLEKSKDALVKMDSGNELIINADASSAYIGNFALKVFLSADNEDQSGKATRTTAKKFLAAAYFFELLKIFDRLSTEDTEKVRYSKWRAADITKAFREGVEPSPAPAPQISRTLPDDTMTPSSAAAPSPPEDRHALIAAVDAVEDFTVEAGPLSQIADASSTTGHSAVPPNFVIPKSTPINPGMWSNTATPGHNDDESPTRGSKRWHGHAARINDEDDDLWSNAANVGSRQSSFVGPASQQPPDDYLTSNALPSIASAAILGASSAVDANSGISNDVSNLPDAQVSSKKVRWTPSVTGGSSIGAESTQPSPETYQATLTVVPEDSAQADLLEDADPTGTTVGEKRNKVTGEGVQALNARGRAATRSEQTSKVAKVLEEVNTTSVQLDLSHKLISQIQKHCRFAISSLEYEDAEQARKELRAALNLLGG